LDARAKNLVSNDEAASANPMWPITIITLDGAEARRRHLEEILSALGLDYELYHGVDARSGVPPEHLHLVDFDRALKVLKREFTPPEIGCALSHLFLAKQIVEQNMPGMIIFEDDAILSEGDYFQEFMRMRVFERADLIQLGYGPARIWRFGTGKRRETRKLFSERLVYNAALATAYSLSHRGAAYLLENALPLRCVADWPCDLKPIRPRIIRPKLVGRLPRSHNSTLESGRRTALSKAAVTRRRTPEGHGETKNPIPRGFRFFHRFVSKSVR
jgi:glycosyl transferase, family 25